MNESLAQTMFDTRNESGGGFESAARGVVHPMGPSDRFFSATVLGGRLHVQSIPDWGPRNSNRIDRFPQNQIVIVPEVGDRMIRTREELETIMREPRGLPQLEPSGFTRAWRMRHGGRGRKLDVDGRSTRSF